MSRFISRKWSKLIASPSKYILKLTLLTLAIVDQFKELVNLPEPYDIYLSLLSRYIIFFFVVEFAERVVKFFYRQSKQITKPDNITIGIGQVSSLIKITGFIFWVLLLFQIDFKELFTSLSIIAAAIAIIAKDYVSNVISGIVLTFNDQISINDQIKIEEVKGRIMDINLTNIHLLTEDDDLVYIPNNIAFMTKIINYTKIEMKRTSIEFELDTQFVSSVEDLEHRLIESLADYKNKIKPDSYNLKVVELHKNNISFKFQYVLADPDSELEKEIKKKTIRRILTILNSDKLRNNPMPQDLG